MDVRYATDEKMTTCNRLINRHPREKRINPLRFSILRFGFIRQLSFLILIFFHYNNCNRKVYEIKLEIQDEK